MRAKRFRLAAILGASQLAQGVIMLATPLAFYRGVPGVAETGPFNPHLMRDTGLAFALAGASLLLFAIDRRAMAAAANGAVYLALHAALHGSDGLAGRESAAHLLGDLPLMFGLAALAGFAVWPECGAAFIRKDGRGC